MTSRSRIFFPSALLLLFCAAYIAYWFYATHEIRQRLERWVATEHAQGREAGWTELKIAGFPFRFEIYAKGVIYQRDGERGRLTWRGTHVTALARAYAPHHVIFKAPGRHELSFQPHDGSETRHYEFTAQKAEASLVGGGFFRFDRLVMDVGQLVMMERGKAVMQAKRLVLRAETSSQPPPAETDDGDKERESDENHSTAKNHLAAAIVGEDILLEGNFAASIPANLPPKIARLEGKGIFVDRIPEGRLLSLAKWRDWAVAGGRLSLAQLDVEWEPIDIRAGGLLGLDASEQITGKLNMRVGGFAVMVDALQASGRIGSWTAQFLKFGLRQLSVEDPDKKKRLPVPLTFSRGEAYLGPFSIGEVSRLIWGDS
jgi:hypothetical protein